MGNKTVFITEFHEEMLKKIREANPTFNLSGYLQDCLSKFGGDKMDESDILKRIQDAENLIKQGQDAVIIWKKKQEEFLIKKALKEKEDKDKEAQRLLEIEQEIEHRKEMQKINDYITNIDNWEEYKQGVKEGKWNKTLDYAKEKLGYSKI